MLKEVNPTETLKVVSLGLLQSCGVPEGELLSDLLTATKFSTHGELLGLKKKKKLSWKMQMDNVCGWGLRRWAAMAASHSASALHRALEKRFLNLS